MALVPLDEVRAHVLDHVDAFEPSPVAVEDALGLALAADAVAVEAVPPFANSAMDGYAVRGADCAVASDEAPIRLRVVGEVAAGAAADRPVGPGEAVRIMTGAPIPAGCDAVVIVEHTSMDGEEVVVTRPGGDHIRSAGGDVQPGDLVFAAGTEIGPAHVGVLASMGLASVEARRRARVGVFSTGDELVAAGRPLGPGQIRESNRPMLLAMAERAGCEPVDLGVVPDDQDAIEAAMRRGAAECDAVVTSGGVSMGVYDEVKVVLDRIGEMQWFQVAIKPAKPFAFGLVDGTPVLGLPGNPVSSFVSFELFAYPAVRKMMGHRHWFKMQLRARAAEPMPRRPDGKMHLDRVTVFQEGDHFGVVRAGAQASNVLSAMAYANALAMVPDGDGLGVGDDVVVIVLSEPLQKRPS